MSTDSDLGRDLEIGCEQWERVVGRTESPSIDPRAQQRRTAIPDGGERQ